MFKTIQRIRERQAGEREGGFTLIELMVVVMIIAILIGIGIPAFLGARSKANDTAAKSNLRNGLATAQTLYTDTQAYAATAQDEADALTADEPSLKFAPGASTATKELSVEVKDSATLGVNDEIVFATHSASGKCFYLRHVNTPGAIAGTFINSDSAASCAATSAPVDSDAGWVSL